METCTVETGLLKKKPCGQSAVSKCGNCEQALCSKHAVGLMSAAKKIFLCPECAKAWKEQAKAMGELPGTPAAALPPQAAKPAEHAKPAAAKPAPVKPAPAKPAAAKPAAAKPAPAEKKSEPPPEHSGPLEFTPGAAAPAAKPTPAPPEKKPEPPPEHSGSLEFVPEPKKPEGTS